MVSRTVKNLALVVAIFATAWAGVDDWCCTRLTNQLRCERSTHILIQSVFFFRVTTIGAHHSVAAVTGAIMCWNSKRSSSAFNLSLYVNGIDRGVLTRNGLTSSVREMWNCSPSMLLICPSNTV